MHQLMPKPNDHSKYKHCHKPKKLASPPYQRKNFHSLAFSLDNTSSSIHFSPCIVNLNSGRAGSGLNTKPRLVISFSLAGTIDLIPLALSKSPIFVAVLVFLSEAYTTKPMAS